MKITDPGAYDIPDHEYQSDPCEEISLRSSTAWVLADPKRTPAHAAFECPRLNPSYVREPKRHFDIGSAAHAMLFGRGKSLVGVNGFDYSRNEEDGGVKASDKRALRDRAYDEGKIPLLIPEWKQVSLMREAAVKQIGAMIAAGAIEANPFSPETSEKVIVWRDKRTNVLCRAALDGMSFTADALSEYKTDGQSAAPSEFQWKARRLGYFFRLAFYRRGLEALKLSYSPTIRIFVQETFPPFLMSMFRVDDELIAREDARVTDAMKIWKRCLDRNSWPGYSSSGYDLGLTEREMMQEHAPQQPTKGAHLASEEMPDEVYSPVKLEPKRKRR